jgi:hypothetical protein
MSHFMQQCVTLEDDGHEIIMTSLHPVSLRTKVQSQQGTYRGRIRLSHSCKEVGTAEFALVSPSYVAFAALRTIHVQ